MASNIVQLPTGPHWRVLVAHQRSLVRHALRTLIESEDVAVVEVADGELALAELAFRRFDLLVLELDLPDRDGLTVMQMHLVMLACEPIRVEPPAIIFTIPPEVREQSALLDHLSSIGVAGVIDDEPRKEVATLVAATLQGRAARLASGKSAAA